MYIQFTSMPVGRSFATRFGLKALYRHLGMKQLWQLSSKKRIPLVVEITGLFHCLQLVTKYLQQFFLAEVERCRCRRPNLALTIWFSFWLRLCGCTLHCKAESGKCMDPEKRKRAFDSISPAGLVNAMSRFGIPRHFCSVVRGIYNGRHFMVRDGGVSSRQHPQ